MNQPMRENKILVPHLLTNGILDDHCISVNGINDVAGSNLGVKILDVLVQSCF